MSTIEESDLSEKSRKLWLKSIAALEQRNAEFAINLLQALVKEEPDFLIGRKALRRAEIQKAGAQAKKKFFGGLSSFNSKALAKKDFYEALADVEKELVDDPFNVKVNTALFELASRNERHDLAEFALETVKEGHPENTKTLHLLAQHHLEQDNPDKAADVFTEIVKRDPSDLIATKGGKDATARASMRQGNWESKGGFRDMLKNEKEAQDLEGASRAGMTKEQMRAQLTKTLAEYADDQNNLALVRKIASAYEKLEEWDNAHQFYSWAHHLSDGDSALERKASQMEERSADAHIASLKTEIDTLTGDDAAAKQAELDEILAARSAKLTDAARERVERNPTDPQLRFELGQHLCNSGNHSEAIPHLQRSRNNPHIRTRAILMLGRCYEAKGMLDMAQSQLEEALSELVTMDNTKKEVLYTLALVAEKNGDQEKYLDSLKAIYEADYGYLDVAQRVESSYGG